MAHTAETLLPWKEYCHNLNHSKMVHISRAKMVCKMHTPVYLFDGCNNEFKHHHLVSKNHTFRTLYKTGKLHFLLMSLNFISLQKKIFFRTKDFISTTVTICMIPVPVIVLCLSAIFVCNINSSELHFQSVALRSQYSDHAPEAVTLH